MDDNRSLTDADVAAIAAVLKAQLLKDFQLEVGKGVIGWAWRVFVFLLLAAAAYGWRDKYIPAPVAAKVGAAIVPKTVAEASFRVIPAAQTPLELADAAERLRQLMNKELG